MYSRIQQWIQNLNKIRFKTSPRTSTSVNVPSLAPISNDTFSICAPGGNAN